MGGTLLMANSGKLLLAIDNTILSGINAIDYLGRAVFLSTILIWD